MFIKTTRTGLVTCLLASALTPISLHAQTAPSVAAPSDSAMVNLVRLLIEQKVLSPEKGAALMAQAQAEADAAHKSAEAARVAAAAPPAPADLPPPASGAVRVAYVPQAVRDAIKQDLRREVMEQAKEEGWASKGEAAPDWTRRITLSGDLRFRSESDLYSQSNSDQILNYAAINQSGPLNIAGTTFPYLNTRDDRVNVMKFRARLNVGINIADGVDANIQIASGDSNSPISTQSVLGGGFAKRELWLQQAWLRAGKANLGSVTIGRMPDPFRHTELLFEDELAFDGVLAEASRKNLFDRGLDLTVRGGAFPLDFGDPNYQTTNSTKTNYPQKWLFAAQGELSTQLAPKLNLTLSTGYYRFTNVQGQLSSPCLAGVTGGPTQCNTDGTVPLFLGKGNTLSYVRQLATLNGGQLNSEPQLFGLTFKYHILNFSGTASYDLPHDRKVDLTGDFIRNVGFKRSDICRNGVFGEPFNNGGSEGSTASICDTSGTVPSTKWVGGRDGFEALLRVGDRNPLKWGQWQFDIAYRRIATDAMLDSLTDADLHLGGTNYKGYIVGGKIGIFNNMSIGAHWFSASQLTAEPLAIDVLEVDLNARF